MLRTDNKSSIPQARRRVGTAPSSSSSAASSATSAASQQESLLPQNVQAEALLLGSILIGGGEENTLAAIAPIVQPGDFYKEAHRLIYRAMLAVSAAGGNVDLMTLYDELEREGVLGDIEGNGHVGMAYVSSLPNRVPNYLHAQDYARIVKRTAMSRELIQAGADVAAIGYGDADLAGALAYAQGRIEDVRHASAALLEGDGADAVFTLADLMDRDFPEPRWVVPGVLPEGLTLLGGKPKMGKSWLMYAIALALGFGGKALGSVDVEQGDVLYLALEDTPRRIKKRGLQLTGGAALPAAVECAVRWPRLDAGGIVKLEEWLDRHPRARLIIVDTLAKVRPDADPDSSVYAQDYHALEGLKRLADQHHLAIVVVHHLRKMAAGDPLDEISGSTGLTGGVDNVLVMRRERGKADAVLHVTGRDIDEQELALTFDPSRGQWNLAGDADEYRRSQLQQAALDALREAGEPQTIAQVAEAMSSRYDQTKNLLWRLADEGVISRADRGRYVLSVVTSAADESDETDESTEAENAQPVHPANFPPTFDDPPTFADGFHRKSPLAQSILRVLCEATAPLSIAEVAHAVDGPYEQAKNALWRMERDGDVLKTARGCYAAKAGCQEKCEKKVGGRWKGGEGVQHTTSRNPDEWSAADNDAWREQYARECAEKSEDDGES